MRVKIDLASDALYFRLDESKIVDSEEVRPGVILDFDEVGSLPYAVSDCVVPRPPAPRRVIWAD